MLCGASRPAPWAWYRSSACWRRRSTRAARSGVALGLAIGVGFMLARRGATCECHDVTVRGREGERRAQLGAGLRGALRAQLSRGSCDRHRLRLQHRRPGPVRDRRDRASEHSRGDQRRDPDGTPPASAGRSSSGPPSRPAPPSRSRRSSPSRSSSRSTLCFRSPSRSRPARCSRWSRSRCCPRRSRDRAGQPGSAGARPAPR